MYPESTETPRRAQAEFTEAARDAAFSRKQTWKELPGNRYTAEELRQMSGEFADATIRKRRTKVMFLD